MARKQVKKTSTKKSTVKRTPNPAKSLSQAMEKEFRDIPARLIAQCQKDASALNRQEKKIKSEVKKAEAQKKIAKNKQVILQAKMKKNNNATNKKQFNANKQDQDKILKAISSLQQQLNTIKAQSKSLSSQQSKYAAIAKLVMQFDKQWEAKARQANKTATKARKKPSKNTKWSAPTTTQQDNQHSSEFTSIAHGHMQESELVETAE